jgi:hypothetical protein
MKIALSAAVLLLLVSGCQKNLSGTKDSINGETLSSDALTPLPCHSISFKIDKADVPGEVPTFRFTKTLYSDTRVKTINMLSRVNPIYPGYQKQAVELIGTFTYGPNEAYLKGTSQVWEYYKTSSGAAARKSISKKNIDWRFYFNTQGYCNTVADRGRTPQAELLSVYYPTGTTDFIGAVYVYSHAPGNYDLGINYKTVTDASGNILSFTTPADGYRQGKNSYVTYTYDYSIPRGSKNYSFIPSQNLISQEYSLLEVMQWLPQAKHQRKGVSGVFYLANGTKIEQKQVYKNYQFDSKGNQLSVTYGDNVPQRTTWFCK